MSSNTRFQQKKGQSRFSAIPAANIPRSVFNRSHGLKTAFDSAFLVPIFVDEVLPGDTLTLRPTYLARLSTPEKPIFDNLFMDTFYFFVPNRLVWDNWQRFMGEQDNPDDTTSYNLPKIDTPSGGFNSETVADYFGIPVGVEFYDAVTPTDDPTALPFRAYRLIWNEWFRDENLQDSVTVAKDDGPDLSATGTSLLKRGKRKDYFWGSLPWPQKGDPVTLPLGDTAPVVSTGDDIYVTTPAGTEDWELEASSSSNPFDVRASRIGAGSNPSGGDNLQFGTQTGLEADLGSATAATINAIRQAFQLQRLFERDARGGTRYTEIVRSHFGVISPDSRLQRPEYLGGGSTRFMVNSIEQQSRIQAATTSERGELGAYATLLGRDRGFSKSFTEHGYIIGLASVRSEMTYQEGLNRMWSRNTRFDFYWPALSHLGEQVVESREIYADGSVNDRDVFGYQERHAEYRYKPSQITGKMRSTATSGTPLDVWHLAFHFDTTRPLLNDTYIQEDPPIERILFVDDEPEVIMDAYFNYRCVRPMPAYSVPGLVDHF